MRNIRTKNNGLAESRGIARMFGVPHGWILDRIRAGELPGVMAGEKHALGVPGEIEKAIADRCKYNPLTGANH